jgi:hypothetical protein
MQDAAAAPRGRAPRRDRYHLSRLPPKWTDFAVDRTRNQPVNAQKLGQHRRAETKAKPLPLGPRRPLRRYWKGDLASSANDTTAAFFLLLTRDIQNDLGAFRSTRARHKPQFFDSQRPVNRALGFCHGLGFNRSLAPCGNACVERDRPFPDLPPDTLEDRMFDAAIFHLGKDRNAVFGSQFATGYANSAAPACVNDR